MLSFGIFFKHISSSLWQFWRGTQLFFSFFIHIVQKFFIIIYFMFLQIRWASSSVLFSITNNFLLYILPEGPTQPNIAIGYRNTYYENTKRKQNVLENEKYFELIANWRVLGQNHLLIDFVKKLKFPKLISQI